MNRFFTRFILWYDSLVHSEVRGTLRLIALLIHDLLKREKKRKKKERERERETDGKRNRKENKNKEGTKHDEMRRD